MEKYDRITIQGMSFGQASMEYHVSNKESYDRLQKLEDEIVNCTIQYRLTPIHPLNLNYENSKDKPKYICSACKSGLPIKYKRFCPNCGVRLQEPEIDVNKDL